MGNGPSKKELAAQRDAQNSRARQAEAEISRLTAKPKILSRPFRNCPLDGLELEAKRQQLLSLQSVSPSDVPYLRLLLLGLVGHGKSSFVNTIYNAFKKSVTSFTPVGSDKKSVTKMFKKHDFKEAAGHFHLCDTMGVEGDDGVTEDDVTAILDGHIKDKYEFNPAKTIDKNNALYNPNPTIKQKMHCVGVCVDATKLSMLEGEALDKIKRIKSRINARGVSFIILLTKIDQICPLVKDDPTKTFLSPAVNEALEKAAEIFGVPVNQVYPVKNYEKETDNVAAIDILAITACIRLVGYANSFVQLNTEDDDDDY